MVQIRKNIQIVATLLCTPTVRGPLTGACVRCSGISMIRGSFCVSVAVDYGVLLPEMDMCFGRNLDGRDVDRSPSSRR
jgi:hypothetical protein